LVDGDSDMHRATRAGMTTRSSWRAAKVAHASGARPSARPCRTRIVKHRRPQLISVLGRSQHEARSVTRGHPGGP